MQLTRYGGLESIEIVEVQKPTAGPRLGVREAFDDLEQRHARGKTMLGMRPVDDSFHGMSRHKSRQMHERS